jgi:hypothetical protein
LGTPPPPIELETVGLTPVTAARTEAGARLELDEEVLFAAGRVPRTMKTTTTATTTTITPPPQAQGFCHQGRGTSTRWVR